MEPPGSLRLPDRRCLHHPHNAEVLASGYDANYGVSALVGATSPIHLVAVALVVPSFGTLPAGYLVSVLGAAAYLHGLALAGVTWSVVLARSSPHSRLLPVLCGLLPFIRPELGCSLWPCWSGSFG